jgi:hypothetical protein
MTNSALLKIDRAAKHIEELNAFLRKSTSFRFVVTTDTKTGERFFFVKENEPTTRHVALICGDVVHNLRSALDHIFWEIVSPHCTTNQEQRRVQFPITAKAGDVDKALRDAYAQRAGTGFYCALLRVRPHGEPGGSEMLFLLRELSNLDKHRLLIPSVDHTVFTNATLQQLISDWPSPPAGKIILSGFKGKIRWINHNVPRRELGRQLSACEFEREVKMPTKITLVIGAPENPRALVPTLNRMVDTVREIVVLLRDAASSC